MKDLVFISVQPDDLVFAWQVDVQLHNFRKYGYSPKARVLVFLPHDRLEIGFRPIWRKLEQKYPEVSFFYIEDKTNILDRIIRPSGYISLLRPYCLREHFKQYPELQEKAIFYHDSDVVFTKYLDFSPFLDDEVNYLSDTRSYIGHDYFESKFKDVKPESREDYIKADPISKVMTYGGITREIARANELNSGGAQYLLKNIDHEYWDKVYKAARFIKTYLATINQVYMRGNSHTERENNGFQSWCADMWAVLWILWAEGKETRCPKELDFAWATDHIDKWDKVYIYHDAGGSKSDKLFDKRSLNYVNNVTTPYSEDLSWVDPNRCSYNYVQEILSAKPESVELFKKSSKKQKTI